MDAVNDALIIDVLAQIERDPAHWRQGSWKMPTSCGTAYCFAGWACVLSGVELIGDHDDTTDANGRHASAIARELLGLSHDVTGGECPNEGTLFSPFNDLNDLYKICARATGMDEQVLRDKARNADPA